MLIHFLIVTVIQLLFIIDVAIYILYLGSTAIHKIGNSTENNPFSNHSIFVFIVFLLLVFAALPVPLYFIIVVGKICHEIDPGVESVIQPIIPIQHCSPFINRPGIQPVEV